MRKLAGLILLMFPALAQVDGVITYTRSSSISITAGSVRCSVSTANSGSTVNTYCYVGTPLVFSSTTTIFAVTEKAQGSTISYSFNGDVIVAQFWRPVTGQPVRWSISANHTLKEDTF